MEINEDVYPEIKNGEVFCEDTINRMMAPEEKPVRKSFMDIRRMFEEGNSSSNNNQRSLNGISNNFVYSTLPRPLPKVKNLSKSCSEDNQVGKSSYKPPIKKKPPELTLLAKKKTPLQYLKYSEHIQNDGLLEDPIFYENLINDCAFEEDTINLLENDYDDVPEDFSLERSLEAIAVKKNETDEKTKKQKYGRKLKDSINEIIETEKRYIEDIKHPLNDYKPKLIEAGVDFSIEDLFSNLEIIYEFHKNIFLPDIEKYRNNLKKLAKTFVTYEGVFELYIEYVRNHPKVNQIVSKNRDVFTEIRTESGRNLDICSYLLAPVQRLPRYLLFMDSLLKTVNLYMSEEVNTSENQSAADRLKSIIRNLEKAKNSIKRILKNADDIVILERIKDFPVDDFIKKNPINIVVPLRWQDLIFYHRCQELLKNEEFNVVIPITGKVICMRCFLFDKMLLFTTIEKVQNDIDNFEYYDHIEMEKLGVTQPERNKSGEFQVWYEKINRKMYILQATPSLVNEWSRYIASILWEDAKILKAKAESGKPT